MRHGVFALTVAIGLAPAIVTAAAAQDADDGLVPWQAGSLAQTFVDTEPQGAEKTRAASEASAYHRRVLETAAAIPPGYKIVSIEDAFIDPAENSIRPIAVLAIPTFVQVATPAASCDLAGGSSGPRLLASLSSLSLGKRRKFLVAAADSAHMMYFLGELKALAPEKWILDVEDFVDVGPVPLGTVPETEAVLSSSAPLRSTPSERRELQARTAAIVRDKDWPYVPLKELMSDPARWVDQAVATIGFPNYFEIVADGPTPHCQLQESYFGVGVDSIEVLLSKLGREKLRAVLRGRRFGCGFAVRGHVRRADNGAFYLEAESFEGVGLGSNVEFLLDPTHFDSKHFKSMVSAVHDAILSARAEAVRRWPSSPVKVEELVLSPKGFLGRRVTVVGIAYDVHRSTDGLVGEFGSQRWRTPAFALRLEGVPADKHASLKSRDEQSARALVVHGTVREKEGYGYIDVDDYLDAGEIPTGVNSLYEILEYSPRKTKPVPASARAAMRSVVGELKRDPAQPYVLFEDLVLEPERWLGRRVSVVGVLIKLSVAGDVHHFQLSTNLLVRDSLSVSMEGLLAREQQELLRLEARYRFIAIKGKLRTASNGGVYLDAESISDIGPQYGDVVLNEYR